jgi:N-acetyl-gamma-glutamyl-phosphate reductase
MKQTVAIAGASGYAGGELLRLLAHHPNFDVTVVSADSKAGLPIEQFHPHLPQWRGQKFASSDPALLSSADLVFLALPHGASANIAAQIPSSVKIVDLGADFRLESASAWQKYYSKEIPHAGSWTYGLPELVDREAIKSSARVANPGCYATAISLAAAPLLANALVDASDVVVVAASGTSGAGRNAVESLLASEVMGSMSSYKTGGVHQHTPEIEQTLSKIAGSEVKLSFTPLLAPMSRGIHVTLTSKITSKITDINAVFHDFYKGSSFVNVLPVGEQPRTGAVLGGNQTNIQAMVDEHTNRVIVTATIDNLVKGAAGQAIQNANLMCGFEESTGLSGIGVAP